MPASAVRIRPATAPDLPLLRRFEQGVIAAERPFSLNLKPDPIRYYDLEAMLDSARHQLLVAEIESQVRACGYARLDPSTDCYQHPLYVYLGFIYVVPEFRGRGISGQLLEALTAWGKARGAGEARLDVYLQNTAAINAYRKVGFSKLLTNMRKSL